MASHERPEGAAGPDAREALRHARLEASRQLQQARRLDEAERFVEELVGDDPQWLPGRRQHAMVASARKDWLEAAARWSRFAELARAQGEAVGRPATDRLQQARRKAAGLALEQGRLEEAERFAGAVVTDDPDDVATWFVHAKVASVRKDWHAAAERLRHLVEAAHRTGRTLPGARGRRLRELTELPAAVAELDVPAALQRSPVVIVENGAHPVLVSGLLDRLAPSRALGERRLEGLRYAGGEVEPLRTLTEGGPEELAIAEEARQRGDRLTDALRSAVPRRLARSGSIDLVEAQRYDLVSRLFSHMVVDRSCRELLGPATSGVLVIRGNARNAAVIEAAASDRLGHERVYEIDGRLSVQDHPRAIVPVGPPEPVPAATRLVDRLALPTLPALPAGRAVRDRSARPPGPDRGDRLVILAWQIHEATLVPVVRELATSGPVTVLVVADHPRWLAPYRDLAERLPIEVHLLPADPADGGRDEVTDEVLSAVRARALRRRNVANQFADRDVGHGVSRRDVEWLLDRLPGLSRFADAVRDVLTTSQASALVTTRDRSAHERVAVMAAREREIPSVAIQPVLMSPSPLYAPLHADHTTVFDSYSRSLFLEHFGARADQLTVTGFARFDDRAAAPEGRVTREERRNVLLTMQLFSLDDAARLLRTVAGSIGSGTSLTVKLHPREPTSRVARYAAMLEEVPGSELATTGPVHDLIERATVVVSVWSNTLLEAALAGKPALSLNLTGGPLPVPLAELGIAYEVRSEPECRQVLPRLLEDGDLRQQVLDRQQAYLRENPHLTDGVPAARRVADVVRRVAGGETPRR